MSAYILFGKMSLLMVYAKDARKNKKKFFFYLIYLQYYIGYT